MPPTDTAENPTWAARAAAAATSTTAQRATRAAALAVPVLLVNAVAFIGQFGWLRQHLPWALAGTVMAALALESIAIYLQWHAHLAQLANDSALRLRVASYVLALGIGVLNYSHYAGPNWSPTAAAVILGLMSSISPWLWSIHSRRVSRDELMARGLIEEHALRLGATRWMWHMARSFRVMFHATWIGETSPQRAINHFKGRYGAIVPPSQPGTPAREPLAHRATSPGAVPASERAAIGAEPWAAPAEPAAAVPPKAVPAVHSASARLAAAPRLPKGVSQDLIDAAELKLAGMAIDQLPSRRAVAREMLDDPNQRRLAEKLLDARIAAETQRPTNLPGETNHRPAPSQVSQLIAWPAGHRPGGVASG
jgi:hypothetical protein